MDITCIADLHGFRPELEGGDLLIVAGDLTKRDTFEEHLDAWQWLVNQSYKRIVLIAGNHDNFTQSHDGHGLITHWGPRLTYLCDSGTEFEGLKIWGSPWTSAFEGMNPKCMAFTVDEEEELAAKWAWIPHDMDILITHSPPYGILDEVESDEHCTSYKVGSRSLFAWLNYVGRPRLHVFGHIHGGYGQLHDGTTHFVNASLLDERYRPVNQPIVVEL